MMRQLKNSATQAAAEKLPEQRAGKIVPVLCDVEKPEYIALYDQVISAPRAGR